MDDKQIINNQYDYSNIIVKKEYVDYLINYCCNIYNQFAKLVEDDEEKNKKFKEEYRDYSYKKSYSSGITISIKKENYSDNMTCKDYQTFKSYMDDDNLRNVKKLKIELNLTHGRGKGKNIDERENLYVISFEPYNIIFSRKTSNKDSVMDMIEQQIKEILDKFPITDSIFCDKSKGVNHV